jgi:hypothetical protein
MPTKLSAPCALVCALAATAAASCVSKDRLRADPRSEYYDLGGSIAYSLVDEHAETRLPLWGSEQIVGVAAPLVTAGVRRAQLAFLGNNDVGLYIQLDDDDQRPFNAFTSEYVDRELVWILDGKVISRARIQEPLFGSGTFSLVFPYTGDDGTALLRAIREP